jgi:hypothetical protein
MKRVRSLLLTVHDPHSFGEVDGGTTLGTVQLT